MKTLVLVQHCQSRHYLDRRVQMGPDRDNGLTDLGRRQAEVLVRRLCKAIGSTACRVYSSDQTRALQTAEILAGQSQQPVIPVPQLRICGGSAPVRAAGRAARPEDRTWFLFLSARTRFWRLGGNSTAGSWRGWSRSSASIRPSACHCRLPRRHAQQHCRLVVAVAVGCVCPNVRPLPAHPVASASSRPTSSAIPSLAASTIHRIWRLPVYATVWPSDDLASV